MFLWSDTDRLKTHNIGRKRRLIHFEQYGAFKSKRALVFYLNFCDCLFLSLCRLLQIELLGCKIGFRLVLTRDSVSQSIFTSPPGNRSQVGSLFLLPLSWKEMFSLKTPCRPQTLRESHFIRKIRLLKELVWYAPVCAAAVSRETKVKHRLEMTVAFYSVFLVLPQYPSALRLSFTLRRASHTAHDKITPRHRRRTQFYTHVSAILSARMFSRASG